MLPHVLLDAEHSESNFNLATCWSVCVWNHPVAGSLSKSSVKRRKNKQQSKRQQLCMTVSLHLLSEATGPSKWVGTHGKTV